MKHCHYSSLSPRSILQQNLFIPSLTDWLTDWKSDWLTDLVIVWLDLDNTCTCSFMSVLLVWSCHRLYSQLGGSNLKLDSQDQRAEEESISIKLKTLPSLFKTAANGKIAQCLWLRARQCISAFRQTDRLTQKDRKEGGRAEMVSSYFFYGIETSVKGCKYWYICLSL